MDLVITYIIEFVKLYLLIFILGNVPKKRECFKLNLIIAILLYIFYPILNIGIENTVSYQTYFCGILAITTTVYTIGKLKSIVVVAAGFIVISFVDMILAGLLTMLIKENFESILYNSFYRNLFNSLNIFLMIVIYGLTKIMKRNPFSISQINKTDWIIVVLGFLITGFYIAQFQIIGINQVKRNGYSLLFNVTSIGIIFIIIIVILKLKNERIDNFDRIHKIQEEIILQQKDYYTTLLAKEDATRKFRHDINEHLYCLTQLLENNNIERAKEYIGNLNTSAKSISITVSTGSYLIDIITNDIIEKYNGKNIKFQWEGKFPEETKLSEYDLCAIFYNLLKNAFEAMENLTNSTKKVCVLIKNHEKTVFITMSNTVSRPVTIKNNKLITSKRDKKNNGYGSQIIMETVNKYGGDVKYSYINELFTIEILFLNIIL